MLNSSSYLLHLFLCITYKSKYAIISSLCTHTRKCLSSEHPFCSLSSVWALTLIHLFCSHSAHTHQCLSTLSAHVPQRLSSLSAHTPQCLSPFLLTLHSVWALSLLTLRSVQAYFSSCSTASELQLCSRSPASELSLSFTHPSDHSFSLCSTAFNCSYSALTHQYFCSH